LMMGRITVHLYTMLAWREHREAYVVNCTTATQTLAIGPNV
jgi:hypothetical protein